MPIRRATLCDTLCQLYTYDVRLRTEFEAEVWREVERRALDAAISSGASVLMLEARPRNPAKLESPYATLREKAIREAKSNVVVTSNRTRVNPMLTPKFSDRRYALAIAEVENEARRRIRKRDDKAGKPVEKSNAWKLTVRWVHKHLDDGFEDLASSEARSGAQCEGVSVVEYYLDQFCRWALVPMVRADGQFEQLAFAHDGIRRLALMGGKKIAEASGYDIVGEHHKLWEKRNGDPGFKGLARSIEQLDKNGGGAELLAEVWGLHRNEAVEVPLPQPSNARLGDGRSGDGAGGALRYRAPKQSREEKKLTKQATLDRVKKYLDDEPDLRELGYRELSSALNAKGLKAVNPTFLSVNLRNTKYDRGRARGNPHRAAGKGEREAVAVDDPPDQPGLEAWIMPDDPT